jgi:hypothetical protein
MDKKIVYLIVGYLVGSFFGVSQLLGLFGGVTGAVKANT